MALVGTEALQLGAFVKHAYPFKNLVHEIVTVNVTAGQTLRIGEPLGEITDTGNYVRPLQTASDGSETFAGIISDLQDSSRERTFASAGTVNLAVLTKGPALLNRTAIETLLDSSFGTEAQRDTFFAGADAQITFGTSEENYGTQ